MQGDSNDEHLVQGTAAVNTALRVAE